MHESRGVYLRPPKLNERAPDQRSLAASALYYEAALYPYKSNPQIAFNQLADIIRQRKEVRLTPNTPIYNDADLDIHDSENEPFIQEVNKDNLWLSPVNTWALIKAATHKGEAWLEANARAGVSLNSTKSVHPLFEAKGARDMLAFSHSVRLAYLESAIGDHAVVIGDVTDVIFEEPFVKS